MRNIGLVSFTALAVGSLGGCQKDSSDLGAKLDEINQKLVEIEKKLDRAPSPGAARAQRPRPARPDPGKVYAVPIEGAPFKGAAEAKITIVEAFEFA